MVPINLPDGMFYYLFSIFTLFFSPSTCFCRMAAAAVRGALCPGTSDAWDPVYWPLSLSPFSTLGMDYGRFCTAFIFHQAPVCRSAAKVVVSCLFPAALILWRCACASITGCPGYTVFTLWIQCIGAHAPVCSGIHQLIQVVGPISAEACAGGI